MIFSLGRTVVVAFRESDHPRCVQLNRLTVQWREYLQVDEQDPFLPPTAASQAIAARTLHNQGGLHGAGAGGPGGICDRGGGVSQYATLNRKFRTLEHPPGARRGDIGEYHCGVVSVIDNQVPDVSQYATVNRKFRTIDHSLAARRSENGMTGRRNEPGNSYTLGSRNKNRMDGPGHHQPQQQFQQLPPFQQFQQQYQQQQPQFQQLQPFQPQQQQQFQQLPPYQQQLQQLPPFQQQQVQQLQPFHQQQLPRPIETTEVEEVGYAITEL
ncbi:Tweety [Nesidiocoris tenuis]|uniref:Tweety n=1 Tax=Nesidiocoris tenuis TaxID=355587 RepID=A0ABN7BA68_9HEMI|nr:Tweety [Nesidiocoris tenuis]